MKASRNECKNRIVKLMKIAKQAVTKNEKSGYIWARFLIWENQWFGTMARKTSSLCVCFCFAEVGTVVKRVHSEHIFEGCSRY